MTTACQVPSELPGYYIKDDYFAGGGWNKAGGNLQSLLFYHKALQELRQSTYAGVFEFAYKGGYSIHDYGCAEGDGTALLQANFPMAPVKGFDLQPAAVMNAQRRWPTIQFEVGDIMKPKEVSPIIWTSHTVEHLPDPAAAVRGLLQRCRWLIVLVPPIGDHDESDAHAGAVGVNTWTNQVGVSPLFTRYFITERRDVDKPRAMLLEETLLFMYQGMLHF